MPSPTPLTFYDISSPLIPHSYAPNPSKSRLALSFKRIPFKTSWTDILDIPKTRTSLHCPATRKLDDGTDFHTLPMLATPDGTVLGDTFDIANFLDDNYPDSGSGRLFPDDATGNGLAYVSPHENTVFFAPITTNVGAKHEAYARFNLHVDATFSAHVVLVAGNMPLNPETAEGVKEQFVRRAHLKSWEDVCIAGEARTQVFGAFEEALGTLAALFDVHDGGPFLEGERANYADLIVGGWVNMMFRTLEREEWEAFRGWHGGAFGRLHDVLQERYWVCE
ncbi:hypothetical protein GQ44DRAFT_778400 [Phaeosphaeriaceae sp. PMI808]|nr:hypothetical protein GQ44DRAFT_778400 [Phaeosphaeriaceae sp. PMI808]